MKVWIALFVVMIAGLLTGCVSSPGPRFFNDDYYMLGGPACVSWQATYAGRVSCYDKYDNPTGTRFPLSDRQLLVNQAQEANRRAQNAQLNAQLQQIGQTFQQAGQQALQQSQSYRAPSVQGIPTTVGATTYQVVGDTVVGSDGSVCHVVGETVVCNQ